MNKKEAFTKLAKDVSRCHICEQMHTKPHCINSEFLENDDHGLDTDMPYVNLWNLWQGNLDADIMVIGQDFGQKEDDDSFVTAWRSGTYKNPTDCGLRHLFKTALHIDIDHKDTPLFFTNAANCYRKQRTSGGMHGGWLPVCVNKFMARLIRIIRPKIIIVLGQAAFEAMLCVDEMPLRCLDSASSVGDALADIMQHQYELCAEEFKVRVFPVYHPAASSKRNRTIEQQENDWMRIAEYYNETK